MSDSAERAADEASARDSDRNAPETADVEQMRVAYGAIGRGDTEAVMAMIHPEVEVRDRPEIPDPRTYHGYDGVRAALAATFDFFEMVEFEPEQFIQFGDRVVIVIRMSGRGKESGVPVEDRIAHLWTMRDGRAWRLQVYSDPDQAIADARSPG
jgi:uncharacterized protein